MSGRQQGGDSGRPGKHPHPVELTLFLPGLLGPMPGLGHLPAEEWPRVPTLRLLLTRARRHRLAAAGREALLFSLFPVHPPAVGEDLPLAAMTRIFDGSMPDDAWWIHADPVYMHADPDRMVLLAHGELGLTAEEADALSRTLAEHLAEDGWRLETGAPERWYLRPPEAPRLTTHTPDEALGGDVAEYLPRGQDAAHWRRLLNELQMLLHTHPVNAERQARGAPPVNSVWFWGGGRVPQVGSRRWTAVWSDSVLARALAMQSGSDHASLPEDPSAWLASLAPGRHLAVLESLRAPLQERDAPGWFTALEALEEQWLVPIRDAVRRGSLGAVRLVADTGFEYELTRTRLRHWWKRPRPLPSFVSG